MIKALVLFLPLMAQGQSIQSDCTPAEMKALKSQTLVSQFVTKGTVHVHDCAPLEVGPNLQYLVAVHVLNSRTGLEAYLSLFDRKGFGDKALALFKSPMVGFDMFPVLYDKAHRLMFLHPSSDKARIVLYLNPQISPAASKLARWEYSFEKKELTEIINRYWFIEAGVLPKIYDDRGTFRALIESRSVEL